MLIVSYAVPDHVLEPFLTPSQELDRWAGQAHVSVVAFCFNQTCVLGFGTPAWCTFFDFPQWNLRFYTKLPASVKGAAKKVSAAFSASADGSSPRA